MLKNKSFLWVASLLTAWSIDFLFWGKSIGISFAILVGIVIVAALILAQRENAPPARMSLWLLGLIVIFAVLT
ncbi:MAG: hypothetical protein B6I38_10165 [Anaerolineaceae bacterium 4572_5.1]|nr:MAG: hypothetical protein B6I38_10165 [Anaerolineaceae bacterium 4572_5.1]